MPQPRPPANGGIMWGQGPPPISQQYGGGGAPPPGGGAPGVPEGSWTNNVQADPYLSENVDWIRERRALNNVQGQKQRAFGDIDQMAAARGKGIEAEMARRGIGNSGIGVEAQSNAASEAERAKVRAGMDIDASEQQRQDALALGAAGVMQAPSRYALGQGALNLQQMGAQQGQQNFMAQFQQQQQQNQMNNYLQMLQMFGQGYAASPATQNYGLGRGSSRPLGSGGGAFGGLGR